MKKLNWKFGVAVLIVILILGALALFKSVNPKIKTFEDVLFIEPGSYRLVKETENGNIIYEDYELDSKTNKVIIDENIIKTTVVQTGNQNVLFLQSKQTGKKSNS